MWSKIRKSLPWSVPLAGSLLYGALTYRLLAQAAPTDNFGNVIVGYSFVWAIIVLIVWIVALLRNRSSKRMALRYAGLIALVPVFWVLNLKLWGLAHYDVTAALHPDRAFDRMRVLTAMAPGVKVILICSLVAGTAFLFRSRKFK